MSPFYSVKISVKTSAGLIKISHFPLGRQIKTVCEKVMFGKQVNTGRLSSIIRLLSKVKTDVISARKKLGGELKMQNSKFGETTV